MNSLRPVAFYLPQFHPIAENNLWWGTGFTEWTNVVKSKPLFKNHYQPHLPADLGFYDLRLAESRNAQAQMARDAGIFGFCYYHYWFNGKRLLERPFTEVIESGQPDFPFMLCWANESWTRTWDGLENAILMKQEYSSDDAIRHLESLLPAFSDPRYIRINGRPVFIIYRSTHIPFPEKYIEIFRKAAQRSGVEIYLCRIEYSETYGKSFLHPGFDAAIEFQPFSKSLEQYRNYPLTIQIKKNLPWLAYLFILKMAGKSKRYNKAIFNQFNRLDYNAYVNYTIQTNEYPDDYLRFPGITPSWDNSPRKGQQAFLFKNTNPGKFGEWLDFHLTHFHPPSADENLLFINAWNEWGEGNHLEPCQRWGSRYLEETRRILQKSNRKDE